MTNAIRNWRRQRRYRATVRSLRSLSMRDLGALGIKPEQILRLAYKASRV